MSVTMNTSAMKYREEPTDPWSAVVLHADAEVNAVVQDSEPTGNENVWFDTSNQTEVQVPTWAEFNDLKNTLTQAFTGQATAPSAEVLKSAKGLIVRCLGADNVGKYQNVFLTKNEDTTVLLCVWNGVNYLFTYGYVTWDGTNGTVTPTTLHSDRGTTIAISYYWVIN